MNRDDRTAEFLLRRAEEEYFSTVRAEALAAQRGIMTSAIVDSATRLGLTTFVLAGSTWIQFRHAGRQVSRGRDIEGEA
jgi:hypothetical protein